MLAFRAYGHGIPHDRMAKLFDPLFSTKAEGLGMGLSICRRIMENHSRRIEASNHDDDGASFSFTLPIASGQQDVGLRSDGRS